MERADEHARAISAELGFPVRGRIKAYIVNSFDEFLNRHPKKLHIPRWAIGFALPDENIIVLAVKQRADLEQTFIHETHHILLGQAFKGKNNIPRWLDEGLAMMYAREWSLGRLSKVTMAALTDSLMPMDQIAKSFPLELRDAELAYCQSFYFISFLKGKFGADTFKQFLKHYSRYRDFEWAIHRTYQIRWERMDELWLEYVALRFSWIPILSSTGFIWFVTSLIFLAGYVKKKVAARKKMRQWEIEERLRLMPKEEHKTYH
ncbi:MAG: hypothetical protein GY868_08495 [Deltaproteobacteria bacterium]|nr:hypothetical protein [Deltaproteobacteria bacterium]